MDQDISDQSQAQQDDPNGAAAAVAQAAADTSSTHAAATARPRRPQRSAKVEGSIDISEPKGEAKEQPIAVANEEESAPDGTGASHPKPPRTAGPKGPGHHPVRAASVPHPPTSRPLPPHLNPHALRALSVAGTADTPAQAMEDFRQVPTSCVCPNSCVSSCLSVLDTDAHNSRYITSVCNRVHIITWNVGSATPPDDITSLLGLNVGDGNTDMYIIGLQEVNSMINKRLKDVLFTDQWSEVCMERLSPFGYVLVASQRMQGLLLLIFAKYFHLPFLRGVQTETTRTGLGGYWGNKGGVSARMSVFGHTICFLNCHLPAHMENSDQRMEDFESILQQQQFEGQAASGVLDHDVVFWFGDLNFRVEDLDMQVVKSAIDNNKYSILWEKDQLNMAKDSETVLEGFQEGPLKFPPTYKFDVGTDTYDTSGKKRKPAWTDRILWRLRATAPANAALNAGKRGSISGLTSGTKVTQHCYRSHMEYTVSDHKPVSSIFTLQFPYKVDIPLVTLLVEDEWNSIADATTKFRVAPNFARSSWDWIGLYKVGFKHHKDYVGYVWAKQEEADFHRQEHQVTFPEEELPKGSGDFILGYYSNNMSTLVGVTEPFQIQLPTTVAEHSSSDSSDFSSEDDSTVVLTKTRSRSPSPRRTKHRHRRSRSPDQAKMKAPNAPDVSASATAKSDSTSQPTGGSSGQGSASEDKEKGQ
uniref:Phosphatidylinositol 4,5-bisphosphate 5-phosphatase A n=1 Tax=Takifugu rubripes TaxID=31033 RepID=H2TTA8_TAKRU